MRFRNSGDGMDTRVGAVRRGAALCALVLGMAAAAPAALGQSDRDDGSVPQATAPTVRDHLAQVLGANSDALKVYADRGFKPIWLDENGRATARANALVAALAGAGNHALPIGRYDAAGLARRLKAGGPALEADLTRSFLLYAGDVSSGVLNPRGVDAELHVFPKRPTRTALIAGAASAPDMEAYLKSLAPQHPNYLPLLGKYALFRMLASKELWGGKVGKGRSIRPGARGPRVAAVRARLTAMGDLNPNHYRGGAVDGEKVAANEVVTDATTDTSADDFDPTVYDPVLVEAVKRFQARHGLNTDGIIGPATLAQINTSPAERARQIAVNLERLRWLNRDLGPRHVLVNLAGFSMAVMENGREAFTSRVVVGKAKKHRTPEFSDEMTFMVINPRWNVPNSIAVEEILPILKNDPTYLEGKNMKIVGGRVPEDWAMITPATFPGRIVQDPGAGNALGSVKFMFPNKFAIYLHDTPSRRLFRRDVRAFSHGCIRVERPVDFAEFLLTGQVDDPRGYFEELRGRGKERQVMLHQPLPVHVIYRTSWVDGSGTYQFRGDIYGRDEKVAAALRRSGVSILQ